MAVSSKLGFIRSFHRLPNWLQWVLRILFLIGVVLSLAIGSLAQQPAQPPAATIRSTWAATSSPTTWHINLLGVPPVEPMVVPAIEEEYGKYGFDLCDMGCTFYPTSDAPGVSNFGVKLYRKSRLTCLDKRRVLVTAESGASLCILFPDPVPPVVKVTIPTLELQGNETSSATAFGAFEAPLLVISGGTKLLQCGHTQEDGSVSDCSLMGGATLDQAMSAILASMKIAEDYRSSSLKICRDGWKAEDDIVQSYLRKVLPPAGKKITIPAPKPPAPSKPAPVKLSPPPYDGQR